MFLFLSVYLQLMSEPSVCLPTYSKSMTWNSVLIWESSWWPIPESFKSSTACPAEVDRYKQQGRGRAAWPVLSHDCFSVRMSGAACSKDLPLLVCFLPCPPQEGYPCPGICFYLDRKYGRNPLLRHPIGLPPRTALVEGVEPVPCLHILPSVPTHMMFLTTLQQLLMP